MVSPDPARAPPNTALPNRYELRGQVRYCRLTLKQWGEAIRELCIGSVPGLGDRWIALSHEQLQVPVPHHPSDLIPVLLYRALYRRDWQQAPQLFVEVPGKGQLQIARVLTATRYSTSSGGQYVQFRLYDLFREEEVMVLLWVEMQMTLVYEPLVTQQPPRLVLLQLPLHGSLPRRSRGGGAIRVSRGKLSQSIKGIQE